MDPTPPLERLRDGVAWPVLPVTAVLPVRKTQDLEPFTPGTERTASESLLVDKSELDAPNLTNSDQLFVSEQAERSTLASVMISEVVVAYPDQTVAELEALLHEHRISGVPVVDPKTGELLGVASQADVIRFFSERADTDHPSESVGYHQTLWFDLFATPTPSDRGGTLVRSIMTPFVYFATETATVAEALDLMLEHRIHRVVVTRERRLVGVVTSMDLLREYRAQL